MIKGFKEFILRGNVIDLAVAVVIGAAFTAVVNSIVTNVFDPLIGAAFKADSLDNSFPIQLGDATIKFGAVIGAIIQFLIVAVVVYFVFVVPINHFKKLTAKKADAQEEPSAPTEAELLVQIRDLLAATNAATADGATRTRSHGSHSAE